MTHSTANEAFEVVRRGYEPSQVDRRLTALQREVDQQRHRADEAERRVQEMHTAVSDEKAPAYAGLGARIEQILGLADEEAQQLRPPPSRRLRSTVPSPSRTRPRCARRPSATPGATQRRRHRGGPRPGGRAGRPTPLRDESERDAKARREEAEALFENNRAKAAQAAADFETTLAHRRDQAERDFTEQMKANEQQLGVVQHRSEQLRLEAEKLRADVDRKSKRTLDEAAAPGRRDRRRGQGPGRAHPHRVRARAVRGHPAPRQHQRPAHQRAPDARHPDRCVAPGPDRRRAARRRRRRRRPASEAETETSATGTAPKDTESRLRPIPSRPQPTQPPPRSQPASRPTRQPPRCRRRTSRLAPSRPPAPAGSETPDKPAPAKR